ncbi:hypothetical protein D3C72_2172610 [compost metagenome]
MRVAGARHGHGVELVLQAVVGFVVDGCVGGLLVHARFEAATLHHEAGDDAVKHRVVVVTLVHVRQEVGGGQRCLLGVQLQGDDAKVGDVQFDLGVGHVHFSRVALRMVRGVLGTF